jgi:hypothetical protein
MSSSEPRLSPRVLGRAGSPIPPIVWRVSHASPFNAHVLTRAAAAGADWVLVDADVPPASLPRDVFLHTIIGIDLETLVERAGRRLTARLDALPGERCDALLLQHATANDLKSGRPYNRLTRLRDEGRAPLLILEAIDAAEAEWMVENTAAHAVSVPYGIGDQLVRYRVLQHAKDLGVAILAREPEVAHVEAAPTDDSLRLRLSDPDVAATIEPLPHDEAGLRAVLARAVQPMSDVERSHQWESFQQRVPAPAKPRGGHPPEFA